MRKRIIVGLLTKSNKYDVINCVIRVATAAPVIP